MRSYNGKQRVFFNKAVAYSGFKPTAFIPAAQAGIIKIDFDARYKNGKRNSEAVRDHGTKFRINISDMAHIYADSKEIKR